MADNVPKGGKPVGSYPPEQERFFLGPYTADQMPQELLSAVRRGVERFQQARASARTVRPHQVLGYLTRQLFVRQHRARRGHAECH